MSYTELVQTAIENNPCDKRHVLVDELVELGLTYVGSGIRTTALTDNNGTVLLVSTDKVKEIMSEHKFDHIVNIELIRKYGNVSFYTAPYIEGVVIDIMKQKEIWDINQLDIDNENLDLIHRLNDTDVSVYNNATISRLDSVNLPDMIIDELKRIAVTAIERGLALTTDFHTGNYAYSNGRIIIIDPFV